MHRTLLLLLAAASPHATHATNAAVDAWTADDIASFLGASADAVLAAGITGDNLFDVTDDDLARLSEFEPSDWRDRFVARARSSIDELDAKVTFKPKSFGEWRSANKQLCDAWIVPLWAFAPRTLGLWARYSNSSSVGQNDGGTFDLVDDKFDNVSSTQFYATLALAPHAPLYSVVAEYRLSGPFDFLVRLVLVLAILDDLGTWFRLRGEMRISGWRVLPGFARAVLKAELIGLVLACACFWSPWGLLSIPVKLGLWFQFMRIARRAYDAYFLGDDGVATDPLVQLHRTPRLAAEWLSATGLSSRTLSHLITSAVLVVIVAHLLRDGDGDGDYDAADVLKALDADGDGDLDRTDVAVVSLGSYGLWSIVMQAVLFVLGVELGREEVTGEALQYVTPQAVALTHVLGEGTFGKVCKGKWLGAQVAVKVLKTDAAGLSETHMADLRREARLLACLRHPHVVSYIAVCFDMKKPMIVTELMSDSLGKLLNDMRKPTSNVLDRLDPSRSPLRDASVRLRMARDVASGMFYLHAKGVFHSDLKPDNVLVTRQAGELVAAKVCDFGISQTLSAILPSAPSGGTLPYMAPEYQDFKTLLLGGRAAKVLSLDVYAFGIFLNELMSTETPFAVQIAMGIDVAKFKASVKSGLRPSLHPGPLGALAKRCWDGEPTKRPTMRAVLQELETMQPRG